MVAAIYLTQGLIASFQEVVDVEFASKVTETIVKNFVANLCVFVAGHDYKINLKSYKL